MVHMSRSRIVSGPVHTHTASATDLPSALAVLQRLALGSGDGWRRLVVDLSTPLDPTHEICGRALGRRVGGKDTRLGRPALKGPRRPLARAERSEVRHQAGDPFCVESFSPCGHEVAAVEDRASRRDAVVEGVVGAEVE